MLPDVSQKRVTNTAVHLFRTNATITPSNVKCQIEKNMEEKNEQKRQKISYIIESVGMLFLHRLLISMSPLKNRKSGKTARIILLWPFQPTVDHNVAIYLHIFRPWLYRDHGVEHHLQKQRILLFPT